MEKELIVLGKWEQAKRAVAECKNVDELKQIKDKAQALRAYAKQARESLEVQNNIAEIKLHAERRIGEFSSVLEKQQGGETRFGSPHNGVNRGKTDILKEAGITHYERYEAIASLPKEEFEKHIKEVKASNEELTTVGVIRLARGLDRIEKQKNFKAPKLPEGKFNVIYADPPWQYDNTGISGSASNHYKTMATEDICNLKIKELSADNAVLFLWVTNPFLKEGLEVAKRWGFEYKTNMVWIKDKAGQGFYVKGQHELLFICVKGNFTPDNKLYIRSVFEALREEHSKKPDKFYEFIETLYPNSKYLELFARNKRDNWTSYGNEI